jgi:beta-1,4-mannosyl-glycoprotein beta-1,4-N-acetylglucosaminyltransferase
MTVFDCTMFHYENDLYEIRLNSHWDFVDRFIVIEAGETHTGRKKDKLNFDHKRFEKYSEKLTYVSFDNFQDEINKYPELLDEFTIRNRGPHCQNDDWIRDHFQHNYLVKVMRELGAKSEDIVYISCLDEMIRKSAFEESLKRFEQPGLDNMGFRPIFSFHLYLYVYKFNLLHKHWKNHIAGMITEYGNLEKMHPATIRGLGISNCPHIQNGGWHFTFLDKSDGELVLEKQRSWAHSRDKFQGRANVYYENKTKEEAVKQLLEHYPHQLVEVLPETHPPYIVDNLDNFQHFIYKAGN